MKVKIIGRVFYLFLSVLLCCSFIFIPGFAESVDIGVGDSIMFAEPEGSDAEVSSDDGDHGSLRHTGALYKATEATAYRGEEVTREVARIIAEADPEDSVTGLICDYLETVYPSPDRFMQFGDNTYMTYRGGDTYSVIIAKKYERGDHSYDISDFGADCFEEAYYVGGDIDHDEVMLKAIWNVDSKTAIEALESNPMVLMIRIAARSSTSQVVPGDVDGDHAKTAEDARLALRQAIGLEDYTPDSREFRAADIDGDGEVTADEARTILRVAIELDDETALRGVSDSGMRSEFDLRNIITGSDGKYNTAVFRARVTDIARVESTYTDVNGEQAGPFDRYVITADIAEVYSGDIKEGSVSIVSTNLYDRSSEAPEVGKEYVFINCWKIDDKYYQSYTQEERDKNAVDPVVMQSDLIVGGVWCSVMPVEDGNVLLYRGYLDDAGLEIADKYDLSGEAYIIPLGDFPDVYAAIVRAAEVK